MRGLLAIWHAWRAYRLRNQADALLKRAAELRDAALTHDFAASRPERRSGSRQPQGP